MASGNLFPTAQLPGLAWNLTKSQTWATRKQRSISGRVLAVSDYMAPIWQFTWNWEFLRDKNDTRGGAGLGTGYDELRILEGFFAQQNGGAIPFLLDDPSDDASGVDQPIATGDGVTTTFQLYRTLGSVFDEPVTAINTIINIKLNGNITSPANYSVNTDTGQITFNNAPNVGWTIAGNFTFYFRVRFAADNADAENFMYQLWRVKELKFESVLLSTTPNPCAACP
jgi:uncharacterized protein (TIGR02217 family)